MCQLVEQIGIAFHIDALDFLLLISMRWLKPIQSYYTRHKMLIITSYYGSPQGTSL